MYKNSIWMAKKYGNWLFLCNFVGMKQTLEDYIRHDEEFRQALLKLGGGILKYWAEHPEDEFDIDLFNGYEKQVVESYLQANKRNRALRSLPDDKLKWDALSWYHHESGKELKFYTDLRPELNKLPIEIKEQADRYFVEYLEDNYREYLRYAYPADIAPIDFYDKVIRIFGVGGLARDCMDYILKDHHHPEVWSKMKSVDVVMTEFYIEEYSAFISEERCFKKLRQGVKEKLAGKNQDECRREAVKMMNSVRGFARMLYSSSEIGITDCTGEYKVDKKWLRDQNEGLAAAFRRDGYLKNSFSEYVGILNDIGRIWAARLLKEHGIDMHELEKEAGAILYPVAEPAQNPDGLDHGNYKYYVDKEFFDQLDDECCIYDEKQAKELLGALRSKQSLEKSGEGKTKKTMDIKQRNYNSQVFNGPVTVIQDRPTRFHQEQRSKFWFDYNNRVASQSQGEESTISNQKNGSSGLEGDSGKQGEVLMWTTYAKSCFNKAVEKEWMKMEGDKFIWLGVTKKPNGKASMSELAYFLGKIYGFVFEDGNNSGARLPAKELNEYFGFNKSVTDTLLQLYRANNIQAFRHVVDDFFKTINQSKEGK